jgi:FtsZ-interacting cell division protein YlmF
MDVKSFAKNAIGSIWGQGGEEAEDFTAGTTSHSGTTSNDRYGEHDATYEDHSGSGHGASLLNGARRLRSMGHSARSHEKNIYTLRPKNLDEAAIAADCLKAGSAVVINHEMIDRATSLRIIDFMSGVCYGLDNQGHAMKLGETIFLFTPGEYEISSDEVDYGENREHFFKAEERSSVSAATPVSPSVSAAQPVATSSAPSPSYSRSTLPNGQVTSHMGAPHVERRSWER